MVSYTTAAALVALAFTSSAFASPVAYPGEVKLPPAVLHPVAARPSSLEWMDKRAPKAGDVPVELFPITKADAARANFGKRAFAHDALIPTNNITLLYAAGNVAPIYAEINATMKYPSVLLEEIDSVSHVDCHPSSVSITFSDLDSLQETLNIWDDSTFILLTNHLGDCDTDNERGMYIVDTLDHNLQNLTITAATTKSTWKSVCDEVEIEFSKPSTPNAKRASVRVDAQFAAKFPELIRFDPKIPGTDVLSNTLSIAVTDAFLEGAIAFSGRLKWSFLKFKLKKFYVDIDLRVKAGATVDISATTTLDSQLFTFPAATSFGIAAFTIPGILSLGPELEFNVGVEVELSGKIDVSSALTASIPAGNVHIDFLNGSKTKSSGFVPKFTHETNISAAAEVRINPFVELTAQIGASVFNDLIEVAAGLTARPQIFNQFNIDAQIKIDSNNNVNFSNATELACNNGVLFDSTFNFALTAFVTGLFEKDIFNFSKPIFNNVCFPFANFLPSSSHNSNLSNSTTAVYVPKIPNKPSPTDSDRPFSTVRPIVPYSQTNGSTPTPLKYAALARTTNSPSRAPLVATKW